ncbi:MAG: alpha/beta hydrolase, partial [Tumebacillaceae bacterium]
VLGMSMGGLVAGIVAGERAAEVDKLALLCPAGEMYPFVEKVMGDRINDPTILTIDMDGDLVGRAFAEDCKTLNVFERSKRYTGDVLLVHGTNDPTVPLVVSHLYQEQAYGGRATLHEIEGADHTFNKYEWEQEAIATVCEFLTT